MVFTSKWRLVDVQNAEAYYKAIHASEDHIAKLRVAFNELKANPDAYIEELTVDKEAQKGRRVVYIKGEKKRDSGLVDLNKEFEHDALDGRKIKGRFVLESDGKLVIHEKGPDFEATVTFVLNGDEITATHSSGGVSAIEKFKRV